MANEPEKSETAAAESAKAPPKRPKLFISQLEFSGGEIIPLGPADIVVFVGPNNSGKSTALRAIEDTMSLGGNLGNSHGVVIAKTSGPKIEEVAKYLIATDPPIPGRPDLRRGPGNNQYQGTLEFLTMPGGLTDARVWAGVRPHFVNRCDCRNRHTAIDDVASFDPLESSATVPLQRLLADQDLEAKVGGYVRQAFSRDFYLFRYGAKIHAYIGDKSKIAANAAPMSVEYAESFRDSGQPAASEGDGIVFFSALLVTVISNQAPILLIDEPEAFLHPPQARFIGSALVESVANETQLFIATHSVDVLQGLIERASHRLHIIRLTREGTVNHAKELPVASLKAQWASPLVRHTQILDALFHERVVICEADGDCDLFRAMGNALLAPVRLRQRAPDVLFIPVMGNSRLKDMAAIVRPLGVPVIVAPDFDTLRETTVIKHLVTTMGGNWQSLEANYNTVVSFINSLGGPAKSAEDVRNDVKNLADQITLMPVPRMIEQSIRKALKKPDGWATAKEQGEAIFTDDTAKKAWTFLLADLRTCGIELNPGGQIESFVRSISGHGPAWVAAVLEQKDLATDPELAMARAFVCRLLGVSPETPGDSVKVFSSG